MCPSRPDPGWQWIGGASGSGLPSGQRRAMAARAFSLMGNRLATRFKVPVLPVLGIFLLKITMVRGPQPEKG